MMFRIWLKQNTTETFGPESYVFLWGFQLPCFHQLAIALVLLKVIFYFGPFLGAFWGLFLFFSRILKQMQEALHVPPCGSLLMFLESMTLDSLIFSSCRRNPMRLCPKQNMNRVDWQGT